MGGRGNAANRNTVSSSDETYKKIIEPEKGLEGGSPTKRSDKIFIASYVAAKDFYEDIQEKDNFALSDFWGYNRDETLLSTRDYKGIQYRISRRLKDADIDLKLGVIDQAKYKEEKQILNSLQKTLNERWRIHKDLNRRIRY